MSQVRKYSSGGATEEMQQTTAPARRMVPGMAPVVVETTPTEESTESPTKSYIIIDGEKIANTEEERQKLRNYAASVAEEHGGSPIWNDIINKAEELANSEHGGDLIYDTPSNGLSYRVRGEDGEYDPNAENKWDMESLNDKQDSRLAKQRSWLGRVLDANLNTKVQRAARTIEQLKGYRNYRNNPTGSAGTPAEDKRLKIGYTQGWFDYLKDKNGVYQKDENGNLKYDLNSTNNLDLQTRIQRSITALGMTPEEAAKHFNTDEFETWASLKQLYDTDPQGFLNRLNQAIDNMVAGKEATPEDISILKLFRIDPGARPPQTEEEKAAQALAITKDKWKNAGYEDLYDNASKYFDLGEDGLLTLNDLGKKDLQALGIYANGGYELNDDWVSYLGQDFDVSPYEWLKGYTVYNGKLYKTDTNSDPNSALSKIYKSSGFYDKNKNNLYAEAQRIINTFWGNKYQWDSPTEGYYSTFTYDDEGRKYRTGRRYRSANGLYSWKDRGNNQIVQYYDEDAKRDAQGYVTEDSIKYAILDDKGNTLEEGLTAADLDKRGFTRNTRTDGSQINYGDDENTAYRQTQLIRSNNPAANNHYLIPYGDGGQYGVYMNPMNKTPNIEDPTSYVLYKDPTLGACYVIPPTLCRLLMPNEYNGNRDLFSAVLNSPKLQEKFRNIIQELGKGRKEGGFGRVMSVGKLTFNHLLKPLGYSSDVIDQAFNEWIQMLQDPQHLTKYVIDSKHFSMETEQTESMKQGGTIRSFRPGGGFGGTKSTERVSSKKHTVNSGTKIKDSRKSAKAFTFKDLTTADKADIVGLGLDLAAIAAGAAPIAGGIVGLGGTGAGLYADIKRDGFQWSDLGNAAVSAAGDVVTMLPGLGSGAAAAKTVAKVASKASLLIKLASAYGAVSAIPLISKAASGNLTWAETRQLAASLAGAINLAKSGGFGKKTQPGDYEDINIKGKGKHNEDIIEIAGKAGTPADTPAIQLTKAQLDEINSITDPIARKAKFREYAHASVKDNALYTGKSKDEILDNYDFTSYTDKFRRTTIPDDSITVKSSAGDPDIVLDKAAIDRINAEPDELKRMIKMRAEIKAAIKSADPNITPRNLAQKARSYNINEHWDTVSTKTDLAPTSTRETTTPDIKLDNDDIKAIKEASDPEAKFIEIVQNKSGDASLTTRDKVKDEFEISDFLEDKKRNRSWRHPFTPVESFTTKNVKRKNDPYAGKHQWWHSKGQYRGYDRDYFNSFTRPTSAAPAPTTVPAPSPGSGTSGRTSVGTNFKAMYDRLFTRGPAFTAAHYGSGSPYDRAWLPERSVEGELLEGYIPDENEEYYMYKRGGKVQKCAGGDTVGNDTNDPISLPKIKIDPVETMEFAKYLTAISKNNKAAQIEKEAFEHMPKIQGVTYDKPTFTDNGLTRTTQDLIKGIYNRTPANQTSDPMLNNFYKKANAEQATKYQNELNSKFSSLLDQHNQRSWEIANKQKEQDVNILNQNRLREFSNRQALAKIESARIGGNYQSFDNLMSKTIDTAYKHKLAAQYAVSRLKNAAQTATEKAALAADPAVKDASNAYAEWKKANPTSTDSFETWLEGVGRSYKEAYDSAVSKALNQSAINDLLGTSDLGIYTGWAHDQLAATNRAAQKAGMVPTQKSGGKVSDSSKKRTYQEQVYIDNQKALQKAIGQLRKETQQLLLKMLK